MQMSERTWCAGCKGREGSKVEGRASGKRTSIQHGQKCPFTKFSGGVSNPWRFPDLGRVLLQNKFFFPAQHMLPIVRMARVHERCISVFL